MWAIGLLVGAIHPLGVVAAAFFGVIAAWFVAALGVLVSARARNSTHALAWTFVALLLVLGNVATLIWTSLMSYAQVSNLWSNPGLSVSQPWTPSLTMVGVFLVVTAAYASGAGLLSFWSIRRLRATWGRG